MQHASISLISIHICLLLICIKLYYPDTIAALNDLLLLMLFIYWADLTSII